MVLFIFKTVYVIRELIAFDVRKALYFPEVIEIARKKKKEDIKFTETNNALLIYLLFLFEF